MLKAGLSKAKRANNHVEEGLEKVRAKAWAQPLGKALEVSGKIVGAVDGFVPGANIIGGALSFGATLLNPEPSPKDLQKELWEIKEALEGSKNSTMTLALEKAKQELEDKIAHPVGEIKVEFKEVRANMRRLVVEVGDSNKNMIEETSKLRDLIGKTFHIVVDTRFKVGLDFRLCSHSLVFLLRMASKKSTPHTPCSFGALLRIFSPTPLRCRQLQSRT